MMKVVHCPCGVDVAGESDDQLVENVESHIESDHPDLIGSYSRDQILSMAHDH
jgi:predicted small metal-binding protein